MVKNNNLSVFFQANWILLFPIGILMGILFILLIKTGPIFSQNKKIFSKEKINYWTKDLGRVPRIGEHYRNEKDGSILVWVPAVKGYWMGINKGEFDTRPRHQVDIDGFWLGKYEVTNEQYQKFLRSDSGIKVPPYIDMKGFNNPKQPVIAVRFYEALDYVQWAGLRLPTEAEWEYAASAGTNFLYATSNGKINIQTANYRDLRDQKNWKDFPGEIGAYPANPFNLHDMSGNAWEWTSSLYYAYPYSATDGREDLKRKEFRVMRGGSWKFPEEYARTTYRHRFDMHLTYDFVGIRVAKSYQ